MKKLIIFLIVILITLNDFAQSPEKMSYQCVIRDAGGILVTNHSIGIRISILQGGSTGTVIYQETYNPNPQTNTNGLVSIEIGSGSALTGIFSAIAWASGPYFLKTETDPTGGTTYTIIGTSQLLSVPYALHSKIAETANYNSLSNLPALNISNWNTAFSWGNHTGLYRPISYVPAWGDITGKPTTLSGYGITDAVNTTGNQTIDGNKTFTGTISVSSQYITNVANPVNDQDAATKSYVDVLAAKITMLENTLKAGGIVTDVDGNSYNAVVIGTQTWMAENLKATKYNDGTAIPNVTDNTAWGALTTGAYCDYSNTPSNSTIYGRLYIWYSVDNNSATKVASNGGKNVCPTGWHVPTNSEWSSLTTYLGGESVAGGKLKEIGTAHWLSPNTGATNETGFTALPGGYRYGNGAFSYIGTGGNWWSSTESSTSDAWLRYLRYYFSNVYGYPINKQDGFSVRCLKDN
jgi:uncharacterized protein (TIGR02145 family)